MYLLNRTYGPLELCYLEEELHRKLRIGNTFAEHLNCSHRYRVKKGGRKEQKILETLETNGFLDDQTCSVCFKLRCDPDIISGTDIEFVKTKDGKDVSLELLIAKHNFYTWLYEHLK
jgi:hypothetical protein